MGDFVIVMLCFNFFFIYVTNTPFDKYIPFINQSLWTPPEHHSWDGTPAAICTSDLDSVPTPTHTTGGGASPWAANKSVSLTLINFESASRLHGYPVDLWFDFSCDFCKCLNVTSIGPFNFRRLKLRFHGNSIAILKPCRCSVAKARYKSCLGQDLQGKSKGFMLTS